MLFKIIIKIYDEICFLENITCVYIYLIFISNINFFITFEKK